MAILSGLPPANTIGPGIKISEIDYSLNIPTPTTAAAGLIGFASKGPINQPTLIQNVTQLNQIFGYPHPDIGNPYLIYAATQFLQSGSQLYVVRVAETDPVNDESATLANCEVPASGGVIQIQSSVAGPYTFTTDSFFRWRLNGILSSKDLIVLADSNPTGDDANSPYTTVDLANALNSQLVPQDGIEFYVATGDKIAVQTLFAYGPNASLELVSVQDQIYGSGSVTGLASAMTAASVTGSLTSYPNNGYQTTGHYNLSGITNLNLLVVVNGTDNGLIDNVVQVIDLTPICGETVDVDTSTDANNVVYFINQLIVAGTIPGGFIASAVGGALVLTTLTSGEDSRILIKSSSTGASIFGLSSTTAIGTSLSGSTGDAGISTFAIVYGAANDGTDTFSLTADSAGVDGNNTQVVIVNNTASNNFTMTIFNNGAQVEAWGLLTKDQTSTYYVSNYLSLVSNWINVIDNTDTAASPADGTYTLTGGTDGIPSDPEEQDDLLIGNNVGLTGLYALSDPEQIDIDLLACPGHTSTAVANALINVCQNYRQDCLALIDPPFGLTVTEIVAWQNGQHPLNNVRFDSDFAALYWPWVMIADNFNGVTVWVPPSGSIMAMIARSDQISAPWMAPAGEVRGIVSGVEDVFSRPTAIERNSMYGNRNAVNPIIQFSDSNAFLAWGQKTLQRLPTALDRVNVRRGLFWAEKQIRIKSKILLFDPNDNIFQQNFTNIATGVLNEMKIGRGIYDFIIVDDSSVNTTDVIEQNSFNALIGIQPERAVEFMFLQFGVYNIGGFTTTATSF